MADPVLLKGLSIQLNAIGCKGYRSLIIVDRDGFYAAHIHIATLLHLGGNL